LIDSLEPDRVQFRMVPASWRSLDWVSSWAMIVQRRQRRSDCDSNKHRQQQTSTADSWKWARKLTSDQPSFTPTSSESGNTANTAKSYCSWSKCHRVGESLLVNFDRLLVSTLLLRKMACYRSAIAKKYILLQCKNFKAPMRTPKHPLGQASFSDLTSAIVA
jgi:hypothetical protein